MYLRIFFFSIFLFSFGAAEAQSFKEKLFTQWGYQAGYLVLPSYDRPRYTDPFSGSIETESTAAQNSVFEFSVVARLRYNLYDISDEQSVGLAVVPALSYLGQSALVGDNSGTSIGINLPLELSYNLGAGSTYNSSKDLGFSLYTGVNFFVPDLFISRKSDDSFYPELPKNFYTLPYAGLGVSFWGSKGTKLREIFLRVEFGNNQHSGTALYSHDAINSLGVRMAYIRYIGY